MHYNSTTRIAGVWSGADGGLAQSSLKPKKGNRVSLLNSFTLFLGVNLKTSSPSSPFFLIAFFHSLHARTPARSMMTPFNAGLHGYTGGQNAESKKVKKLEAQVQELEEANNLLTFKVDVLLAMLTGARADNAVLTAKQ